MKKLVFAAQVFGLIAMLPIVVILEMNHVTSGASQINVPSDVIMQTEKSIVDLPGKAKDKWVNEPFSTTLEMLLLKTTY